VKYNEKSYLHKWLAINSILFHIKENWNPWVWISLCWQPPFYWDVSLCSKIMREEFWVAKWQLVWIEESEIIKCLVYSVMLHLFIVLRILKLSMRSVLFNLIVTLNWSCYSMNIIILKLFWSIFRSFLLHYRYTGGILTVVRACSETQIDYSNSSYITGIWVVF
jgi:hypothetical protein